MPDFERWEFGNPETVAARKESKTCKGCKYLESIILLEGLARWPHPPKNNCKKFLRSFVSCV